MKIKQNKTNAFLVVISLLAMSLFASCDKDENSDTSDTKCLISNLNDTWEVACNEDTDSSSRQISFTYDADDRLSKWEWDDGDYILFEYNSNGKLVQIEELWDGQVDYLHFTWEGHTVTRQRYVGDEPGPSKVIIEFNSNDEIVRVDGYYKYDQEWVLEWYDMYTWQNGNVVKVEAYYIADWEKSKVVERREKPRKGIINKNHLFADKTVAGQNIESAGGDFVPELITTYTYDDKHNPFSLHQALGLWDLWSPLFQSKNNVVLWIETGTSEDNEDTWTATLQYEYNAQDYPGKLIIEAGDDECNWVETIEINYKNCD